MSNMNSTLLLADNSTECFPLDIEDPDGLPVFSDVMALVWSETVIIREPDCVSWESCAHAG